MQEITTKCIQYELYSIYLCSMLLLLYSIYLYSTKYETCLAKNGKEMKGKNNLTE